VGFSVCIHRCTDATLKIIVQGHRLHLETKRGKEKKTFHRWALSISITSIEKWKRM